MRFQVLTATNMKMVVFCNVAQCSPVDTDCMVQYSRRLPSSAYTSHSNISVEETFFGLLRSVGSTATATDYTNVLLSEVMLSMDDSC
jgi:hypothetical protein